MNWIGEKVDKIENFTLGTIIIIMVGAFYGASSTPSTITGPVVWW